MKQKGQYLLFLKTEKEEFKEWLFKQVITRDIFRIQQHHEYSPDYEWFNEHKGDHFALLENNRRYHIDTRGFIDIAQNLTTFPDGAIAVCRPLNVMPAGITGANRGALCIENVGNFDSGGDIMTSDQEDTIIWITALVCTRFKCSPNENTVIYHHWYDPKTCPGTNFFGGNTMRTAQTNFYPLVIDEMTVNMKGMNLEQAVAYLKKSGGLSSDNLWLTMGKRYKWLGEMLVDWANLHKSGQKIPYLDALLGKFAVMAKDLSK